MMGAIPQPPVILVKDDKAALIVRRALHKDWAQEPPVIVTEDWPEDWHVNAVVLTPLRVIGTEWVTSFSISGDISDRARTVLNTYINLKRAKSGGHISYRDIGNAANLDRRQVGNILKELVDAGIGVSRDKVGFSLDIGSWRPDANKAREQGLTIEEWT